MGGASVRGVGGGGSIFFLVRLYCKDLLSTGYVTPKMSLHCLVHGTFTRLHNALHPSSPALDAITPTVQVDGVTGAELLLKGMDKQGRYCVEAWS